MMVMGKEKDGQPIGTHPHQSIVAEGGIVG